MSVPNTPIVNAGLLYINNLQLTWVTTSTITISSGAARDSLDINDISLDSAVTVNSTVVGANGVDVAPAVSASFYRVFAIGDSTQYSAPAGLLSLSSSPNLPVGYDMYRRIGWVSTSASSASIQKFLQYGRSTDRFYYYDAGVSALTTGSSATFAAFNLGASVPPVSTRVQFDIAYTTASSGGTAQFLPSGSTATSGIVRFGCGAVGLQVGSITVPAVLSSGVPQVQYKVGASDSLTLLTTGFSDFIS